jgi:hypothetical protein
MVKHTLLVLLVAAGIAVAACVVLPGSSPGLDPDEHSEPGPDQVVATGSLSTAHLTPTLRPAAPEPIVIPDCHLVPASTQDVPARHDGQLLFIGRELEPGEPPPPEAKCITAKIGFLGVELGPDEKAPEGQVVTVTVDRKARRYRPAKEEDELEPGRLWVGTVTRSFRRLRENDRVKKGQLLGLLDPALAVEDLAIKSARLVAAQADWESARAARQEAEKKLRSMQPLVSQAAVSQEDYRTTVLAVTRGQCEEASKRQAIDLARSELNQARTLLRMHEIRCNVDGAIRSILKRPGEAVKNLETVVQVHGLGRLRVEGLMDVQHLVGLQAMKDRGRTLVLEPTRLVPPRMELSGHLLEVTGVAVGQGTNQPVVSSSEDGTVRVWDLSTRRERWIFPHPAPVRAVACTLPGACANLCLSGAADGIGRLWDLDSGQPGCPLAGRHTGPINCVAFGPDGASCITGGEDGALCLWETATGRLRARFPAVHRGRITSLQFTRDGRLLSAGGDNTLILWTVAGDRAEPGALRFDRRGGDVAVLGIDPNGSRLLFDRGRVLRVLATDSGQTEGVLRNRSGTGNFTTFALFAPDGKTILTASAAEPSLQLWSAPGQGPRPHEVRQLVGGSAATCAAFAPDGSFVATGMKDRLVLVWPVPAAAEITEQLPAEITLVEPCQTPKSRQVRVWAEIDNPGGFFLAGSTAALVAYPVP